MIWTTTGNLTNIRSNAKFDFGVAMPQPARSAARPTGGGNFFIFKSHAGTAGRSVQSSPSG